MVHRILGSKQVRRCQKCVRDRLSCKIGTRPAIVNEYLPQPCGTASKYQNGSLRLVEIKDSRTTPKSVPGTFKSTRRLGGIQVSRQKAVEDKACSTEGNKGNKERNAPVFLRYLCCFL